MVQGQHGPDGLLFVKATDGRCIPKEQGRTFRVMMVCLGLFLDMNISFRRL